MMKAIIALLMVSSTAAYADTTTTGSTSTTTGTGQAASSVTFNPQTTNEASKQPASVFAPSMNPTVSCAGVRTGGLGIAGLQIAGGSSVIDAECQNLERIKMVYMMNDRADALEMTCATVPGYREARLRVFKQNPTQLPCSQDIPADYVAPVPTPVIQVQQEIKDVQPQPQATRIEYIYVNPEPSKIPAVKKLKTQKPKICKDDAPGVAVATAAASK